MNRLKQLLPAVLLGMCLLLAPAVATAEDLFAGGKAGVDCSPSSSASTSAVCQQHTNKDNPLTGCPSKCGSGIFYDATNIISVVAGGAAVIVMIVGALRFATSGSNVSTSSRTDTDIENARRTIGGAVVGLVIIILARTLVLFVLSKL